MSLAALRASMDQGPAVSPFLVLGDPNPDVCVELARTAVSAGAPVLEIGVSPSDPLDAGAALPAAPARPPGRAPGCARSGFPIAIR